MFCLTVGRTAADPPAPIEQFSGIKLGDTKELDPCWDRLLETDGLYQVSMAGVLPVVISRLFRVAVDVTTERLRKSP
jgi:hypothetical protein